jgi:hypothetical protein
MSLNGTGFNLIKSTRVWLAVLIVAIQILWLSIKLKLFDSLEYTNDLLVHTQKSRSFLSGYPLLYDNFHGPRPYHNTFAELFFAPFTWLCGAFGLFIPYSLILCASYLLVVWSVPASTHKGRAGLMFIAFFVLLGPVAFWTFDNPIHGWHPEFLSFPFSLLFACQLLRHQGSKHSFFYVVPLLLTHEGGAISAWAIHSLYVFIADRSTIKFGKWNYCSRLLRFSVAWFSVFLFGLLIQKLWDQSGDERLTSCLSALLRGDWQILSNMGLTILDLVIVLQSACLIGFLFTFDVFGFCQTIVCCLPMALAMTLASLAYTTNVRVDMHNTLWAPRFSFSFGIACSGLLFSLAQCKGTRDNSWRWYLYALSLGAVALIMQNDQLMKVRNYSLIERIGNVMQGKLYSASFKSEELKLLECLNGAIPSGTPIIASSYIWAAFHEHNLDPENPQNPLRSSPEIRICDISDRASSGDACRLDMSRSEEVSSMSQTVFEGMQIQYLQKHHGIVDSCILAVSKKM